ncbi:MAG: Helix-turn-helix domain [Myxococcaceae bacterium]|nr:Helix-turn-helix domain [Myxococcaceae bacterium]
MDVKGRSRTGGTLRNGAPTQELSPQLEHPSDAVLPEEIASALSVLLRAVVTRPAPVVQVESVEPWLTVAEGARHAAVSEETLREWITLGQLPAGRCGRVLRVRRSDIDAMLMQRQGAGGGPGGEPSPRSNEILATLTPRR